jgi:hypothetical protein
VRERRDQRLLKGVGPTGEHLPQDRKVQEEDGESLLVTTRNLTTKKEERKALHRILPKVDFLKANQRSGVSVLPPPEVVKKAAKEEVLAASLQVKNQADLRNGKAKSLLLFPKSRLAISHLDSKRRAGQKKSLTLHLEIKSHMENVAAPGIKSPMQNEADRAIKSHIQNAVIPTIKSPIRNEADLEIKKKVFQRVLSTGTKRDSRRIFLQKNPV